PRAWKSEEWEEDVAIDWWSDVDMYITGVNGPGGAALRTRSGETRFDNWGSLESETTETAGGVRTTVTTRYVHRPGQWLLSLPRLQEVTSTTPGGTRSETRRTAFSWTARGRIKEVEIEPLT